MAERFTVMRVSAPDPVEKPEKPHRCGRCNNGTGVYNSECPNSQQNRSE